MMMPLISDLLSTLGKGAAGAEVRQAIADYDLVDVYDDPPFRRYVGSKSRGLCLLFENDRVIDIQIYARPTKSYSEFSDPLPFEIQKGSNQQQVHQLLGKPEIFDQFDSKYTMKDGAVRLTIVYNNSGVVRYLSIALPKELR
jgi:hypothetical protein